jgi:nucleotidyltransferase/DNA polymerase involved in DNA repair
MEEPVSLNDVPGVGSATASKLRPIGITTIEALAVTPIREITDKSDIGFEKALQTSFNRLGLGFKKMVGRFESLNQLFYAFHLFRIHNADS